MFTKKLKKMNKILIESGKPSGPAQTMAQTKKEK